MSSGSGSRDDEGPDWVTLNRIFSDEAANGVAEHVPRDSADFASQLAFAVGRMDDGRGVGEFLSARLGRYLRVLDVGSGNGGVALAVASLGHEVHALDVAANPVFRRALARLAPDFLPGGSCAAVVASGAAIPFPDDAFDAVLCLETIEHVDDPGALGSEIMRVLRPGGICLAMTPARWKFVFRRDPHFGIPALLLLPDAWQRIAATRFLRRVAPARYDVTHTFWTLRGLAGLFPNASSVEPLFNRPRPGSRLWRRFRRFLWDRVLVTKAGVLSASRRDAPAGRLRSSAANVRMARVALWRPRTSQPVRLHIGSGTRRLPGWINIDNQRLVGVDRVLDVTRGLPYDGVAAIYAEHFLEHLPLDAGLAFLTECRRALRPDGVLRLSTPNLAWVLATHYRPDPVLPEDQGLFDCLRTNRAFHGWGHQFLYNRSALSMAFRASGFADVTFHAYGESGRPELAGLEGHEKSDDAPDLPHVLIAEAEGRREPAPLPADWMAEFRRDIAAR